MYRTYRPVRLRGELLDRDGCGGVCHRAQHPQARPGLGDLVVAAAELDGHPLAAEPERLRRAAAEIVAKHPDASPDDVLLWAEARALSAA